MTKILQKKFVITSMTAITVLLLLLLGAINIVNTATVFRRMDENLMMISGLEGNPEKLPMRENDAPSDKPDIKDIGIGGGKNDYDTFMSSNFFVVMLDGNGNAVLVDTERTSSVTDTQATEMAQRASESGNESGYIGRFRYRISIAPGTQGTTMIFLDTTDEIQSSLRILLISGIIGIVCWALMLLFVILLSRRAIRPIAENIERQKQFVTNAGHEIKTPLAIIRSNTDAMELYNGENKWSKNIKEQTVRLTGLMQNLLMLSRMDEGAAKIEPIELDFSGIVSATVQGFSQLIEDKSVSTYIKIPDGIGIFADKNQIEQLCSILIDNAVKYVNNGGEISVSLSKENKKSKFSVENTCDELPDVLPYKLFDRFYRSDSARTQSGGGYGIGLSLAQSIVQSADGKISAEYVGEKRIRFTVII